MTPRRKSVRLSITVPTGIHEQIKELSDRVDCSEAEAVRWLLFMGLDAMQQSKNPFKNKAGRSFKGSSQE